jgi:hypothetical protein
MTRTSGFFAPRSMHYAAFTNWDDSGSDRPHTSIALDKRTYMTIGLSTFSNAMYITTFLVILIRFGRSFVTCPAQLTPRTDSGFFFFPFLFLCHDVS